MQSLTKISVQELFQWIDLKEKVIVPNIHVSSGKGEWNGFPVACQSLAEISWFCYLELRNRDAELLGNLHWWSDDEFAFYSTLFGMTVITNFRGLRKHVNSCVCPSQVEIDFSKVRFQGVESLITGQFNLSVENTKRRCFCKVSSFKKNHAIWTDFYNFVHR